MNLKLKVYRESDAESMTERAIKERLPWVWVIVDINHNGGWWQFSKWAWPASAVVDSGRASDGVVALRIGLFALADAHRDHLVGAE